LAWTKNHGLIYGMSPLDTELFQGADFAADIENRQSISGFLFKSNRTLRLSANKQQHLLVYST